MFCNKCGNAVDDGAIFCKACGAKIRENGNTDTNQANENVISDANKVNQNASNGLIYKFKNIVFKNTKTKFIFVGIILILIVIAALCFVLPLSNPGSFIKIHMVKNSTNLGMGC